MGGRETPLHHSGNVRKKMSSGGSYKRYNWLWSWAIRFWNKLTGKCDDFSCFERITWVDLSRFLVVFVFSFHQSNFDKCSISFYMLFNFNILLSFLVATDHHSCPHELSIVKSHQQKYMVISSWTWPMSQEYSEKVSKFCACFKLAIWLWAKQAEFQFKVHVSRPVLGRGSHYLGLPPDMMLVMMFSSMKRNRKTLLKENVLNMLMLILDLKRWV